MSASCCKTRGASVCEAGDVPESLEDSLESLVFEVAFAL